MSAEKANGGLQRLTSKSEIIAEPDSISPTQSPSRRPVDFERDLLSTSPKLHRTSTSKRLTGRLPDRTSSITSIPSLSLQESDIPKDAQTASGLSRQDLNRQQSTDGNAAHAKATLARVVEWLNQEKRKRASRKPSLRPDDDHSHHHRHGVHAAATVARALTGGLGKDEAHEARSHRRRKGSEASEISLSLDELERILASELGVSTDEGHGQVGGQEASQMRRTGSKRKSSKSLIRRGSGTASSDTDHPDNELLVPSVEAVLDNSKTLGYASKPSASQASLPTSERRMARELEAWRQFKTEILTLTHTLQIAGWKRVPIEQSLDIDVERLSGCLTNAVYVVTPPKNLVASQSSKADGSTSSLRRRSPTKLILRVYGPQVGHLIDREGEIQILRRLARKKIGPQLLGTFVNGRFEQFLHARTLTAPDLRVPETSKQIAKRMRELHDGIDLLKEERDGGPAVFKNWDKWVERAEKVGNWLDKQIVADQQSSVKTRGNTWRDAGFVCGVPWPLFRRTVEKYRAWLVKQYGGSENIRKQLIFAHNDTQYGNLLRLEPSGESPLLLPANEHKQLVVIDFEYASANTPGLEFANHFTEWCYDYHDSERSWAVNERKYPTPAEQHRFLRAYLQHRPPPQSPLLHSSNPRPASIRGSSSPNITANPSLGGSIGGGGAGSISSISSFMLDSRAPPPPGGYLEEERQREEAVDSEIQRLRHETRLWRTANSARWIAWGLVQAKVKGLNEALLAEGETPQGDPSISSGDEAGGLELHTDPLQPEMAPLAEAARDKRPIEEDDTDGGGVGDEEDDEEEGEAFDNLGYARDRALFFWGDVLQLGLVQREDLPAELLEKVKIVQY